MARPTRLTRDIQMSPITSSQISRSFHLYPGSPPISFPTSHSPTSPHLTSSSPSSVLPAFNWTQHQTHSKFSCAYRLTVAARPTRFTCSVPRDHLHPACSSSDPPDNI